MFVMICYDVPAERTGLYRKLLKEYLMHEQYSVFMGDLPESEVIRMIAEIAKTIGPEDKLMKLTCKNRHNVSVVRLAKKELGGQMSQESDVWHGKNWAVI